MAEPTKPSMDTTTTTTTSTSTNPTESSESGKSETVKRPVEENDESLISSQKKRVKVRDDDNDDTCIPDPILPSLVAVPSHARWMARHDCVLFRKDTRWSFAAATTPFTTTTSTTTTKQLVKVAAFDLDGTLLLWRITGWPSQPEHYELWSASVIAKLQELNDGNDNNDDDSGGYMLVIFTNQGGIRTAAKGIKGKNVDGKNAQKTKGLLEWLIQKVNRPIHVMASTSSKSGYHKPEPKMWHLLQRELGVELDKDKSFFVGDSDGSDNASGNDDYQARAVDKDFAANIGISFYSPTDFFGPSDMERRKQAAQSSLANYSAPPAKALVARRQLLGGYGNNKPILLILVGVQGSGKSTVAAKLVESNNNSNWVHYSQDTIRNGKTGTRQAVEMAVQAALLEKKNVVVDRMHVDAEQRSHFVQIGRNANVAVHALVLHAPAAVIESRVRNRTNHLVKGDAGVKLALQHLDKLSLPTYDEGFDLISIASTDWAVESLCKQYQQVALHHSSNSDPAPILSLGTMIGKGKKAELTVSMVSSALKKGFCALDTAPTYNNEAAVGEGMLAAARDDDDTANASSTRSNPFLIVKVPKRATQPNQVREEVLSSLQKLGVHTADLVLLHWPCDLIEAGTLASVWQELEQLQVEGKCNQLGVCNFSVDALRSLLPHCKKARPVVNQVERHPLLPQWDLVDFCACQDVQLQAHTPLGHARPELMEHEIVLRIAKERNLTAAQVLLKWNMQQHVATVVKCSDELHQEEAVACLAGKNDTTAASTTTAAAALLTPAEMELLDSIGLATSSSSSSQPPTRFVAPPFMFKPGAAYSWGDRAPGK